MHLAFDGGSLQQGLLGGIYQVTCGFLNAACANDPDLEVTLVCDSRQGEVQARALRGLSFAPRVVYAPVCASYDLVGVETAVTGPDLRFIVDGDIVEPVLGNGEAVYDGPAPTSLFAILSRVSSPPKHEVSVAPLLAGVRVDEIIVTADSGTHKIAGSDRRLSSGFTVDRDGRRWTTGTAIVPITLLRGSEGSVRITVRFAALSHYTVPIGPVADVLRARAARRRLEERAVLLQELGATLIGLGCQVYMSNHFTPIIVPGLINAAWAYDMIPVLFPHHFHSDARVNFDVNVKIFKASTAVYTISGNTRNDLIKYGGVRADVVKTAGIALATTFKKSLTTRILPDQVDVYQSSTSWQLRPLSLVRTTFVYYLLIASCGRCCATAQSSSLSVVSAGMLKRSCCFVTRWSSSTMCASFLM